MGGVFMLDNVVFPLLIYSLHQLRVFLALLN